MKKNTKRTLFVPKFKANDKAMYRGKQVRITSAAPVPLGESGHLYYQVHRGSFVADIRSDKLTPVTR